MTVIEGPWPNPDSDGTCPACLKVTSVRELGHRLFCTDCDLAFEPGDHERVTPEWRHRFFELQAATGPAEPLRDPPREPVCATCQIRHPHPNQEAPHG